MRESISNHVTPQLPELSTMTSNIRKLSVKFNHGQLTSSHIRYQNRAAAVYDCTGCLNDANLDLICHLHSICKKQLLGDIHGDLELILEKHNLKDLIETRDVEKIAKEFCSHFLKQQLDQQIKNDMKFLDSLSSNTHTTAVSSSNVLQSIQNEITLQIVSPSPSIKYLTLPTEKENKNNNKAIKIIQPSKAIPVKIPPLAITHKRAVNEQVHDVLPTKQLDRSVQPITITIPIIFPPQVISTTSNQNVISNILKDNDIYRKDMSKY
ncbi:unnamed protein product [Didymodactylos carnosus]|uniref:Uncharacterized protein n=1 Tax=Didymodactylos carnosus TaxID=1234261 RepID=A0A814WIV0_9BILA|nr:unnamed protein product [Didymodactylos carnosus]CAF1199060.1 unnamed protein product [Didymodactylos carnosus]CAF3786951.1 unnamed protein product [Didymodactylos carnosus]CAF3963679.1 unnamed protein product [Didymodactylos carnosus]